MRAKQLSEAMGGALSLDEYRALVKPLNQALRDASARRPKRASMLLAQICAETGGLRYSTEIASGAEYNGRTDLGNTQPGDGERFKGRGYIQLTGRNNYTAFGRWLYQRGQVPHPLHFIAHPEDVALPSYAFQTVVFYWAHNHNHGYDSINAAADAEDIVAATYMVNGGQNGIDARRAAYQRCRALGQSVCPGWGWPSPLLSVQARRRARHAARSGAHYDPAQHPEFRHQHLKKELPS